MYCLWFEHATKVWYDNGKCIVYGLNMQRKHGMIMANVLFKNYCHLYSPRSEKEPKQKFLKLGD